MDNAGSLPLHASSGEFYFDTNLSVPRHSDIAIPTHSLVKQILDLALLHIQWQVAHIDQTTLTCSHCCCSTELLHLMVVNAWVTACERTTDRQRSSSTARAQEISLMLQFHCSIHNQGPQVPAIQS